MTNWTNVNDTKLLIDIFITETSQREMIVRKLNVDRSWIIRKIEAEKAKFQETESQNTYIYSSKKKEL